MNAKLILYILVVPLSILALNSLNFNNLIRKNKVNETRILYLLFAISISYLVVNFIYEFFELSKLY